MNGDLLLGAVPLLVLTVTVLVISLVRRQSPGKEGNHALAIYRDQLAEIERDVSRGLLTVEQAEGTRIEIQRRLLRAAADSTARDSMIRVGRGSFGAVALVGVGVPVGAVGLYLLLGSPALPDQTVAVVATQVQAVEHLVDELARHMEATPERIEGWLLLARSQRQIGRYAAAAQSFRMAIEQGAEDFDTLASYGEMLVRSRGGQVPPKAEEIFHRAYRAEPNDPRAAFYLGMVAWQAGDSRRAIALWRGLEARSLPEAPWLDTLHSYMATVAEQANLDPTAIAPLSPE